MTERSMKAAQEKAQQNEKYRQKRMLSTAIVLLVLAGGVAGGTFFLERVRANQSPTHDDSTIPDMQPEKQAARLTRAQEIRGKWAVWAREHASDLKAMRLGNRLAHQRVLSALPTCLELPRYGLSTKDLCGGQVRFSMGDLALGAPVKTQGSTPEESARLTAQNADFEKGFAKSRETHFTRQHDPLLCSSSNAGSKAVCLWVSGRVTELAVVEKPHPAPGEPVFSTEDREIIPAYNFLEPTPGS